MKILKEYCHKILIKWCWDHMIVILIKGQVVPCTASKVAGGGA